MQTAFLKLLGIKSKIDLDEDESEDGGIEIALADDGLKKEFRRRRNELHKYILTAARLIAPKIVPGKEIEGYEFQIVIE